MTCLAAVAVTLCLVAWWALVLHLRQGEKDTNHMEAT